MQRLSTFSVAVLTTGIVACGSSNGAAPPSTGDDAGDAGAAGDGATGDQADARPTPEAGVASDAGVDHGAPSSVYPAFMPDLGQIQNNAGLVMTVPIIVPITWDVDGDQANYDSFAANIGATSYFRATTTEYGVMAARSAPPIHLGGAAPAVLGDGDLQGMIQDQAGVIDADAGTDTDAGDAAGPVPLWPAATDNTIYAFFLPPQTSLSVAAQGGGPPADACSQGIGGYHGQVTVGKVTASYAVVASCNFGAGLTPYEQSTASMSHELVEASTDPHPSDRFPGWIGFDVFHFAFDWFNDFQSEVADACEFFVDAKYEEKQSAPPFDFFVQRTWSNASAAAGHNPCVPLPSAPYFNVTPLDLTYVSATLPASLSSSGLPEVFTTSGVRILPGSSGTIELGFYSDGPTGGPWTLSASEGNGRYFQAPQHLGVSIDKPSGQNGEKAVVTVTVTTAGSFNAELLTFTSTMGGVSHYMPVVVSSM
jgi:hypothetical protein